MKYRWKTILTAALICLLAACTSENPGNNNAEDTGGDLDAAADADDDSGDDDSGDDDSGPRDTALADVDPDDADGDVGSDDDTETNPGRTIADYRRCFSDSECPVGLGTCIKEVALNRPDANGAEKVSVGEIFDGLEDGQGICTEICTESADACAPLSVNGTTPDPVAHVCQVVVVGDAPYPAGGPSFPFDDQLDSDEQTKGQAFGAICRPPFELDEDVDSSFCSQCQSTDDCAESGSLCWSRLASAPVTDGETGICLSACSDQSECPLGFSCDAQDADGQGYCRPTLDTCTDCQDVDDDGFGTGRCGPDNQPITPHDCDDRNADAYFDPSDMEHAFPATCGEQDFNCNGLSDQVEQVGPDAYPVEHCTACFDNCEGALDNGRRACQADSAEQPACLARCDVDANGDPTHADCDGDITNGCEVPIDDPSRLYYADVDGDGYGDPNDVYFACDPSQAPSGYVSNSDDCNDSSDEAWGGNTPAEEICDGIDNDCDGDIDEDIPDVGQSCSSGADGICDAGTKQCAATAGIECVSNIAPGTQTETCDGLDNDCDGETDEDGADGATAYYVDADGDNYGDENATARYACSKPAGYVTDNSDCNDGRSTQNPGTPELCSTSFDDNCDGDVNEDAADDAQTWYADSDSDTFGNPNSSTQACTQPSGYVSQAGDCNDGNQQVNPNADEVCNNGTDDDCDGNTDDSTAVDANEYYRDRDGDMFGDPGNTTLACSVPGGYTTTDTDCNDDPNNRGGSANPGEIEICDGIDNDCDGSVDEGCPKYYTIRTGSVATRDKIGTDYNGVEEKTSTCGANRVWTDADLHYYANTYPVQEIDIGCRDIVINEDRSTIPYSYSVGHDNYEKVDGAGGWDSSSDSANFACGDGEAIYKVTIEYDQLLYKIKFHCRKYKLNGSGTAATLQQGSVTTATSYGGDASNEKTAECGYNQVAIGARMNADKTNGNYFAIYGFKLYCQTLELESK
ncbi:MAG: MopE-related protein [Myxococcota bacterium]